MKHCFGAVKNGLMMLNEAGKIVEDEIINIPKHRKNVAIDVFVVMPNHVHIIIGI
jgi:REP element-mobilizing transposase RayT